MAAVSEREAALFRALLHLGGALLHVRDMAIEVAKNSNVNIDSGLTKSIDELEHFIKYINQYLDNWSDG